MTALHTEVLKLHVCDISELVDSSWIKVSSTRSGSVLRNVTTFSIICLNRQIPLCTM